MEFAFHLLNTLAPQGAAMALKRLLKDSVLPPVVLCVGSDLAIGDSLGPIAGTLLREKLARRKLFLYGTLRTPVTAKEIRYLKDFFAKTHPGSKVIAIDAAVGDASELGLIKISDSPLRPGSGANKRLGKIGDISVLGIIGEKSAFSYASLNLTRLNTVYTMAEIVAFAVAEATKEQFRKMDKNSQFSA